MNKSYRQHANSAIIPYVLQNWADAATRTPHLSCFHIRDLIRSRRGEVQQWTYFQVTVIVTGTWISNIHRMLQALEGGVICGQSGPLPISYDTQAPGARARNPTDVWYLFILILHLKALQSALHICCQVKLSGRTKGRWLVSAGSAFH